MDTHVNKLANSSAAGWSAVVKKATGGLAAMLNGSSAMLAGLDHMLDALPGRQDARAPAATPAFARVRQCVLWSQCCAPSWDSVLMTDYLAVGRERTVR